MKGRRSAPSIRRSRSSGPNTATQFCSLVVCALDPLAPEDSGLLGTIPV